MPTTEFTGDDTAALNYIRERGYGSYSSIKNVRDKVVPSVSSAIWFKFGHELHSRGLEKKKLVTLNIQEERDMAGMTEVMDNHSVVQGLLKDASIETAFGPAFALKKYKQLKSGIIVPDIYGVPVYGRIDILGTSYVADLKSTFMSNGRAFAAAMDFLQAVIYMKATGVKNFYYIGVCKKKPYTVMVFNVVEYQARLKAANEELKRLLIYIKSKL